MFTGIITNIGNVKELTGSTLTIRANNSLLEKLTNGTSIAINGVCLTVVAKNKESFSVDVMPETTKRTTLWGLRSNDKVNLELPATPYTFLSGHIIQGHVDTTAKVKDITEDGNSKIITFSIPKSFACYIVEKGSIAVNGISLTVIKATNTTFSVGIIPHTWDHTMLHNVKIGDEVNIEVDILAKYVEKLTK